MRHVTGLLPPIFCAPIRWCSKKTCTTGNEHGGKPSDGDIITPWNVTAAGPKGVDYDRVLTRFKSKRVDEALLAQLQEMCDGAVAMIGEGRAEKLHHFFRRGIVFSHRDFDLALHKMHSANKVGVGATTYLYTGRGPSTRSMHLGHVVPFLLAKYLQDTFGLPLVIQITDDEKHLFRDIPLHPGDGPEAGVESHGDLVEENIKDIIAFGFDRRRTFIFRNTTYMGTMYPTVVRLQRTLTLSAAKHTLGLKDSDNVGKAAFPATQAAPCCSDVFPEVLSRRPGDAPLQCIVPCAIDQDPFFVLARASAARLKFPPPALLHTKFLPALKGLKYKMSSSNEANGVIKLRDEPHKVKEKIRKAFSGGCGTLSDMQSKGVDLSVDVAYQFIRFFSPSDELFEEVTAKYSSGKMNSAQVKELASEVVLQHILSDWQERRKCVTEGDVRNFTSVRSIVI
ncbi:putative tRNA synthetases class I (W and Y) [Trypanosoma vivax]|uniref:tryptophan--tRNA ligase n=1 Tax=Trypanosoma vivax (strain Y486) TaxID=1055687 RepID=G0U0G6_TRYVY|nr:putative tryptophanyl-tRNA synthetase [Trypanosoma vivax]KAH8610926.1 putative tRNA synthetases class I (W and Y) [Trypanosoma vivax]CCC49564.1 putative tryptophanyl-tRNA synthetase [Trypanosoma vivax Y486]